MLQNEIVSNSPEETFQLGEQIGREIRVGDVVLLYGDLGAGKTLLTKGILDALDFDADEVTSPSFALVNLYRTGELDVYHIDLWRIEASSDAASAVGLHEILENENSVVVIEWADRLGDAVLPKRTMAVQIEGYGDEARRIRVNVEIPEKI